MVGKEIVLTIKQIQKNNKFIHDLAFKEIDALAEKRRRDEEIDLMWISPQVRCMTCGVTHDRETTMEIHYKTFSKRKNKYVLLKKYLCTVCQVNYRPYDKEK